MAKSRYYLEPEIASSRCVRDNSKLMVAIISINLLLEEYAVFMSMSFSSGVDWSVRRSFRAWISIRKKKIIIQLRSNVSSYIEWGT